MRYENSFFLHEFTWNRDASETGYFHAFFNLSDNTTKFVLVRFPVCFLNLLMSFNSDKETVYKCRS